MLEGKEARPVLHGLGEDFCNIDDPKPAAQMVLYDGVAFRFAAEKSFVTAYDVVSLSQVSQGSVPVA